MMKMKSLVVAGIAIWIAQGAVIGFAQNVAADPVQSGQSLPSAPSPQPQVAPMAGGVPASANAQTSAAVSLTLKQAEALALKNNPQISVARLTALASHQVTREARSNLWPTLTGDLTAVDSHAGSRITAGALNNPIIYERAAGGVIASQLITDFGRTSNLISSASLAAKAEDQNAAATKEEILLAVDQAFYGALQAQAVLTVAQQTVNARQTVADQVGALFKSKLRSELDFSFANVNLAQAKLLILDAENNQNAALATLSMILGDAQTQNFKLVEDTTAAAAPPGNIDDLVAQAFAMRPEILSLEFQEQSAQKFHNAERDLMLPNIRAIAAAGDTPVRVPELSNWYGAAGVNVEIPLFNGFLYSARARRPVLERKRRMIVCSTCATGSRAMCVRDGSMPIQPTLGLPLRSNCSISRTSRSIWRRHVTTWG
jgi:outer membrane protein